MILIFKMPKINPDIMTSSMTAYSCQNDNCTDEYVCKYWANIMGERPNRRQYKHKTFNALINPTKSATVGDNE